MSEPRRKDSQPRDPGAYIGRLPERATQTVPGGVGRKDRRVSAVGTQPGPVRGAAPEATQGDTPAGHREGDKTSDDQVREAGENH